MADDADLSAEQTEKLVYFQEITHIESFDECKQILEAFEWNIESAVQNTFNDQGSGNNADATAASTSAAADTAASRLSANGGGGGGALSSSSLSSSTSSLASSSAGTSSAAAAAAAFFEFNKQNNDMLYM